MAVVRSMSDSRPPDVVLPNFPKGLFRVFCTAIEAEYDSGLDRSHKVRLKLACKLCAGFEVQFPHGTSWAIRKPPINAEGSRHEPVPASPVWYSGALCFDLGRCR